jgi:ATP-binding cassette subfamily C protein LapB
MVIVTHRTALLELVDRLIVIDSGRIVADGPKEQVVDALRQGRIGRAQGAA